MGVYLCDTKIIEIVQILWLAIASLLNKCVKLTFMMAQKRVYEMEWDMSDGIPQLVHCTINIVGF